MGGIKITTPLSLAKSKDRIEKLKAIPSSLNIGKFGHIDIKYFKKPPQSGLQSVVVKNLCVSYPIVMKPTISSADFLWSCRRKIYPEYYM